MARSGKAAKRSVEELSARGPHEVLRGDLALVGMPGVVYTPAAGLGLPAVAFGHGWLQPAARYTELFGHLASWGFVVAAPNTQRGALPSHRRFATDLRTALDVCTGVRLGSGTVSVDPGRLALAGHCMGGGCAVLAAADEPRCAAVVTLALAETRPAVADAARRCAMPAMHIAAGKDLVAPPVANAEPVAQAWVGTAQLRTMPKANHLSFTNGRHWSDLLLDGSPHGRTRRLAGALVTAFLLRHLTGSTEHDALLESDVSGATVDRDGALTG